MCPFFNDLALVGFFARAADAQLDFYEAVLEVYAERDEMLGFINERSLQLFYFIF